MSHLDPLILEKSKQKYGKPNEYHVYLLNDDFTTMDFVVSVLMRFFALDEIKAEHIMWQIHQTGKGLCGKYSKEIAETKVMQVNHYARENGYPLLCEMEKAE